MRLQATGVRRGGGGGTPQQIPGQLGFHMLRIFLQLGADTALSPGSAETLADTFVLRLNGLMGSALNAAAKYSQHPFKTEEGGGGGGGGRRRREEYAEDVSLGWHRRRLRQETKSLDLKPRRYGTTNSRTATVNGQTLAQT